MPDKKISTMAAVPSSKLIQQAESERVGSIF